MTLTTGANIDVNGVTFQCVEARTEPSARYEVQTTAPSGSVVQFSASSEAKVLAKASSWVADLARRKKQPTRPVVRTGMIGAGAEKKPPSPDVAA
jgi:hypothetical protein